MMPRRNVSIVHGLKPRGVYVEAQWTEYGWFGGGSSDLNKVRIKLAVDWLRSHG